MKDFKLPTTLLIFGLFINSALAQTTETTQKLWATIHDKTILPESINGKVKSDSEEFQAVIDAYNITTCVQALPHSKKANLLNVYEISCESCDQFELMIALDELQAVTGIEIAPTYTPLYEPDDYHMAFEDDYALDMIGAQEAWELTQGDTSIHIAITDTNFDLDHQELEGTLCHVEEPLTHPNLYHGTAVAITAAGNSDNGIGKSSIGSDCMLALYSMSYDNILEATYSGAQIINISWTSGCFYSAYVQDVIDEAYENGSIIVAAAGNGETCGGPDNYVYPASLNHVISVTSIGPMDNHERFEGDPSSTHQHNDSVDYCAPGYDVALTVLDGWYLTGNGTSFAAPYVSGTIGLMLSVNPCLTFEEVEFILDSTSANIDMLNPAYAGKLGEGQIHAAKAVAMAAEFATFDFNTASVRGCTPTSGEAGIVPVTGEGTAPYDINWSNGGTTSVIEGLEAGWYYVDVVDAEGCIGYDSVEVITYDEITSHELIIPVLCNGDASGEIELTVEGGGLAPYSFLWSTDETTTVISDLEAGTYAVTITGASGCTKTDSFIVEQPEAILLEVSTTDDYESLNASEIDLEVTGGIAPYTYEWNNESITEDITELEPGIYEVIVTDANNCTASISAEVFGPVLSLTDFNINATRLYPNPASNNQNITLSWSNPAITSILVNDAAGRAIQTSAVSPGLNELKIQSLPAGIYIVNFMTGEQLQTSEKLIITN